MTIECAFYGFVAADAEQRTSQSSGKPWVRLRGAVGKDEAVRALPASVAHAIRAGELLIEAKRRHGKHGQWATWLNDNNTEFAVGIDLRAAWLGRAAASRAH